MYPYTRRDAIAQFACLEQIAAMYLRESSHTPEIQEAAQWVADRLGEIEPRFLAHADRLADPPRQAWLDIAERCLAFYTSELRRLQDRVGHAHIDYLTPQTTSGYETTSPRRQDGSAP